MPRRNFSQLNCLKVPGEVFRKRGKKYDLSDDSSIDGNCFPFHPANLMCFNGQSSRISLEEYRVNRQIDKEIARSRRQFKREIKVLLLGAGESGKSTFIKQMKIIHGDEFNQELVNEYKQIIYSNILRGMKVLVDARDKLNIAWADESNATYAQHLQSFENNTQLTSEQFTLYASSVYALWCDEGIKKAFDRRNEFCLSDGVHYLFQNLTRISTLTYQPSNDDILHARKATKAICEYCTSINNIPFKFVDVGGQRSQRQKWIKCFDSVTSIIFFVASSEYDQVLVEDKTTNRLFESLNIFDFVVNNRLFSHVSMILFLNKCDILKQKIDRSNHRASKVKAVLASSENTDSSLQSDASDCQPEETAPESTAMDVCDENHANISHYLPDYTGDPYDVEEVKKYLVKLFCSVQTLPHKSLFAHCTTAVDTENIRLVFNDVKRTILDRNIRQLMLQ